MTWTLDNLEKYFKDNDVFLNNYCNDFTKKQIDGSGNLITATRILARRIAELAPHSAHKTQDFGGGLPLFSVSNIITKNGNLEGKNWVIIYLHENNVKIGFRLRKGTTGLENLANENLFNILNNGNYVWNDFDNNLITTIKFSPEIKSYPLLDEEPIAKAIRFLDAKYYSDLQNRQRLKIYLEHNKITWTDVLTPKISYDINHQIR